MKYENAVIGFRARYWSNQGNGNGKLHLKQIKWVNKNIFPQTQMIHWNEYISHREHVLFMPKCNVNLPLIMLSVGFAWDFYIGHKISISIWSAFIKSHELICRKLWQDKDQIKFMIQGDSNKSDGSTETFANKQRASIEIHICHLSMDHMFYLRNSSPSLCRFVRTYAIAF